MTAPGETAATDATLGESRWPPIVAVTAFLALDVALRLWLPSEEISRLPWLVPVLDVALVAALITSDPVGVADRRRRRRVADALVWLLVVAALYATGVLVADLIAGTGVSTSPGKLLAYGGVVWLGNNLAFGLLFWLLDGGGPLERAHGGRPVDFAFVQQLNPELGQPAWRPVFLDYLHLGFTNATAFSPTDTMPLTHRAKYAMLVQSTVALVLLALVVARAVNAFHLISGPSGTRTQNHGINLPHRLSPATRASGAGLRSGPSLHPRPSALGWAAYGL